VPLPETIPVKYTEEEAGYLSVRPVVRQTFRLHELVDMVLAVTGKEPPRVQQILRSGTTVFRTYRYWWQGFEAEAGELAQALSQFPDPWPERPFRAGECTRVHLETAPGRGALQLEKKTAARGRWLRRQSVWDCLAGFAEKKSPRYEQYSYEHRADLFVREVVAGEWPALQSELVRSARRGLRPALAALPTVSRVVFFCPRA